MATYILQRLLSAMLTVFGVLLIVFILVRILPGDPVYIIAGYETGQEDIAAIKHRLGLDKPIYVQFLLFVREIFSGNLGDSIITSQPIIDEIRPAIFNTLVLVSLTLLSTTIIGATLGVIATQTTNSFFNYLITFITSIGLSTPSFFLGIVLILIFSVRLGWLPSVGVGEAKHLILPILTLTLSMIALTTRMTRSSLLDILSANYIQAARAKGLGNTSLVLRHALPNALNPIITVVGLQASSLLGGGAVIVETIFAYPGIGWLLTKSITSRDYPLIQSCILFIALSTVFTNLVVDLLYFVLDPRLRTEKI